MSNTDKPETVELETVQMTRQALLDNCIGHPYAKIPWPHRLLHDAVAVCDAFATLTAERDEWKDRAEKAEAGIAEAEAERDELKKRLAGERELASNGYTDTKATYDSIQRGLEQAAKGETTSIADTFVERDEGPCPHCWGNPCTCDDWMIDPEMGAHG